MAITRASLLSLAVVAAAAATARAQDNAPVIRELQVNGRAATQAQAGAVVVALGRNFFEPAPEPEVPPGQMAPPPRADRFSGLEVKISGTDCFILDSTLESVTFIIPAMDVGLGRKKVEITVRGRGTAKADLEVVAQASAQQRESDRAAETGGGRAPDQEEVIRGQFRITRFELKRDAAGSRFEVDGVTGKLPDGFTLDLVLTYNDREIEPHKVRVAQGGFKEVFGPYTKELLFGNFAVNMLFQTSKQGRVKARQWMRTLTPVEQQTYDRVLRREFLTHGTDEEIGRQRTEMQAHFRSVGVDAAKILADVEAAYASGCRQFFRTEGAPTFNEAEFLAYIQRMGFAKTPAEVDKIKADMRFSTRNGHFKPQEYEQFATTTLIPAVQALFTKHREFRARFIAPMEPRADMLGDYLVSIVFELFREYSRNLYERAKIELPEALRAAPIDPVSAPTISRRFFEAQRRLLLRTIGLGAEIPAGEGDGDQQD